MALSDKHVQSHLDGLHALTKNDVLFRALIENSLDIIILITAEGLVSYVSPSITRIMGYHPDTLLGHQPREWVHPDDLDRMQNLFGNILQSQGKSLHSEYRLKCQDGSWRWFEGVTTNLLADPQVGAIVGNFRDITERKHVQEALQEEEQRFRMVWESASDAMALSDPEGKVLAANGAYYQLYGFQPEVVIGNTFAIIFSKEEQELATAQYKAFFSSEKVDAPLERSIQRADGTIRIVEVSYDFLVQQGKRIAMISIIRDITERKRAEEALRTSEERLRLALEAGNIGVWDWDVHDNNLTWSKRIYELHGVSKDIFTVSFEKFLELVHPEDKASVEEAIGQSLTAHVPFNINFRIVTPQGETRWIATSASVSYDPEGKPIRMLGATSDITGQKELEQRKDEFITIASHELKTPITALKGFAQLHRRKLVTLGATELVISLDKINGQVDRLTRLVNDLLDVSKIQAGHLDYAEEPIVLDTFIQDIVETTQQITPIHTIVIHGTSNKVIIGDSDRLQQVFFNLINNAAIYSPQANTVDILIATSQERAMVSVHDYGVGIAKEHKDKIFDRFYRVHDAENKTFRGLGMGLYISYEIVKRHGGEITVESEEGKGSTFTVSLPFIN